MLKGGSLRGILLSRDPSCLVQVTKSCKECSILSPAWLCTVDITMTLLITAQCSLWSVTPRVDNNLIITPVFPEHKDCNFGLPLCEPHKEGESPYSLPLHCMTTQGREAQTWPLRVTVILMIYKGQMLADGSNFLIFIMKGNQRVWALSSITVSHQTLLSKCIQIFLARKHTPTHHVSGAGEA